MLCLVFLYCERHVDNICSNTGCLFDARKRCLQHSNFRMNLTLTNDLLCLQCVTNRAYGLTNIAYVFTSNDRCYLSVGKQDR